MSDATTAARQEPRPPESDPHGRTARGESLYERPVITMKVYAAIDDPRMPLRDVPAYAQRVESMGFDGLLVPEAVHDGFLTALLALEHTQVLAVATSVVVAFPRSPTTTAYAAWDLQGLSGGRFELGLGSQVKGNIVGRFGVEWRPPVPRMRDYVGALRSIWASWQRGEKLDFASENYRLDRMQPFFTPEAIAQPDIPVFIGGVNPLMMRLAGEVGDGLMTHPTNTSPRYLRERIAPALRAGAARSGRSVSDIRLIASTFVATGATKKAVARERERLHQYMAFLYSTPQYWRTLELHGRGDVGRRLHDLSRAGRWEDMKGAMPDDLVGELVPAGPYDEVGPTLLRWYRGLATGITLRVPESPREDSQLTRLINVLHEE